MQTGPAKRTIEELLARYELEPSLRDVYVEGDSDWRLIRWFLDRKGRTDIQVYKIGSVELSDELFRESGLNPKSNRDAVVLLATRLSECFGSQHLRVRCVADADFDRHVNQCRENGFLLYTDYTSMEMYLFKESCIAKFIEFVAGGFRVPMGTFMKNMSSVLRELYIVRLCNEILKWGMQCVDLKKYTEWDGHSVTFHGDAFLKACLLRNDA
jgi:hypothetical protein